MSGSSFYKLTYVDINLQETGKLTLEKVEFGTECIENAIT